MNYRIYSEEEDAIIINNIGKMCYAQIQKLLPSRTICGIRQRAKTIGARCKITHPYTKTKNENFWKDINTLNSYWAGLLNADGSLGYYNKAYSVKLGLKEDDKDHLELFKIHTNTTDYPTYKIYRKSPSSDNWSWHYRVSISNTKEWFHDLEKNFGVIPQKPYRNGPPNMSSLKYKLSFIIGSIDGDGYLSYANDGRVVLGLVGCGIHYLQWVKDTLDKSFPYIRHGSRNLCDTTSGDSCKKITYQGYSAAVIIDCLSKIDVPKLNRKWNNPLVWEKINRYKGKRPELFVNNTPENLFGWI